MKTEREGPYILNQSKGVFISPKQFDLNTVTFTHYEKNPRSKSHSRIDYRNGVHRIATTYLELDHDHPGRKTYSVMCTNLAQNDTSICLEVDPRDEHPLRMSIEQDFHNPDRKVVSLSAHYDQTGKIHFFLVKAEPSAEPFKIAWDGKSLSSSELDILDIKEDQLVLLINHFNKPAQQVVIGFCPQVCLPTYYSFLTAESSDIWSQVLNNLPLLTN